MVYCKYRSGCRMYDDSKSICCSQYDRCRAYTALGKILIAPIPQRKTLFLEARLDIYFRMKDDGQLDGLDMDQLNEPRMWGEE